LPLDKSKAAFLQLVAKTCFFEKDILWKKHTPPGQYARNVIVTPRSLIPKILEQAHGQLLTGHGGINKTKHRIQQSYYWPNMEKDIEAHLQQCQRCQYVRTDTKPPPHVMTPMPLCTEMNQRVHMDLFGPLKTAQSGAKYILCMTDAFTKYVELAAIPNKEAETVADRFFNKWICRYGAPKEIFTDQGREFVNKILEEVNRTLEIRHGTTSGYHPQSNSTAEVCNKTIQKYLASFVDRSTLDWELYLPPLAFCYNTSLHESTKHTPFFLTHGFEAYIPGLMAKRGPQYSEETSDDWKLRLELAKQVALETICK